MNKISNLIFAIGAVALLAACSDPDPRSPEEIVAERAQARWDALVAQDFETAREYYTPGYRQQTSAADFADEMQRRPVKWTDVEVRSAECSEEEPSCRLRSVVSYQVPASIPGAGTLESKSAVTEIWLQINGEWWYSADA
ncbi:MAG: lipoprotein [Wenzhouxiangellaceae bacterium]|nr:lipoprotein [Wenzhouxiangellaceae bacterium]MBS3824792.1 lipoprotein [Wenzhouxiangellaceae bacterium]